MKREIKFRGKRIDNGEWVYGMPAFNRDCTGIDKIEEPMKAGGICRLVDPETVGQYTGKKDIEGNELYDGDITIDEFYRKSIIYWSEKMARFAFRENRKKTEFYLVIEHLKVKKIGNRWDNPDLLEGGYR
ncbi:MULTISPECIES: YopX family protein [Paenibacillus]|uniref:YopX family protein n=1 Tax=Paenibacillus TaxID=44249 RepID=UPI0011A99463|nr:YopX family protein [Paenibacillus sp. IHBB 10380]